MQFFYTPFALFFFAYTSLVLSFSPLQIRQTDSEQLPNDICGFDLVNGHTLNAQCTLGTGLVSSFVPLEKCITNICGELSFLTSGGFSTTCNECALYGITLDITCTCLGCDGQGHVSMLNLSAIGPDDNGIFIEDNLHIACRSPNQ